MIISIDTLGALVMSFILVFVSFSFFCIQPLLSRGLWFWSIFVLGKVFFIFLPNYIIIFNYYYWVYFFQLKVQKNKKIQFLHVTMDNYKESVHNRS